MPAQPEIIIYNGTSLTLVPHSPQDKEEERYSTYWQGREVVIYLKQDNEGAPHWFEAGTDKETEFSKEVGLLLGMKPE